MKCSPTFATPRRLGEIFVSIGVTSVMWLSWTWHGLLMGWQWAATTPYPNKATIWQMQQGHALSCLCAMTWQWYALAQISCLMMMTTCPRPYHHHNATAMTAMTMTFWSCPPPYPQALSTMRRHDNNSDVPQAVSPPQHDNATIAAQWRCGARPPQ